jgi:hypothetical protein
VRSLPFGKRLKELREQGADPWLVMVSVGNPGIEASERPLRGAGVAYVRVPDDVVIESTDWRFFVGLDVLVICEAFCTDERFQAVCRVLWRMRVATMRVLDESYQDGRARAPEMMRNPMFTGRREQFEFFRAHASAPLLDDRFKDNVVHARETSMLLGAPPLFSCPEFASLRERGLRELLGDLYDPACL